MLFIINGEVCILDIIYSHKNVRVEGGNFGAAQMERQPASA
jgi:hypothetical protein